MLWPKIFYALEFLCNFYALHEKWSFRLRKLVTFTDEILNGKLHFSYSDVCLHSRGVFKNAGKYVGSILLQKHFTAVSH